MVPIESQLTAPIIYSETDLDSVEQYKLAIGRSAIFCARSPFKETVNEDALALIPVGQQSAVLVIADGLGGLPAGEVASRLAVATLAETLGRVIQSGMNLREAVLDGIERANEKILSLANGCSTTLAVVELQGGMMRSYHVGDSSIMLVGQRGKLKFQSVSHSPVGYAVEAGLLNEAEAVHHAERNVVSNVLGTSEMRIDIGPAIKLAPRDTLLLASDGLLDNLYTEEVVSRIKAGSLGGVAELLVRDCRNRMEHPVPDHPCHPDDLSIILYRPQ